MVNTLVSGKIVFDSGTTLGMGLTVNVFLEDVSQMDMPAKVVAEYTARDVVASGIGIPFELKGEKLQANHRYEVRVHLSRDGSHDFKKGDFISTESHSVDPLKTPVQMNIKVQLV